MIDKRPNPQGEKARSEPEIIPPGHAERGTPRMHVHIGKPSPLGIILVVLITGLLSAAMLILFFGVLVVFVPLVVLFVTAVFFVGLLRFYFRQP
jgi:hypothetical protein